VQGRRELLKATRNHRMKLSMTLCVEMIIFLYALSNGARDELIL
jgi:hypothetical protein